MSSIIKTEEDLVKSALAFSPQVRFLHLVVRLLRRLSPVIQLAFALIGLIIAVCFGYKLERRLTYSHQIIANGLHANLETSTHPHKGVAAFLLSGLEANLRSNPVYHDRLKDTLKEIDNKLKESREKASAFNTDEALKSLQLEVKNPGKESNWQKMVVAKESPNRFLMVPALSLRRASLSDAPLNDQQLGEVLKQNPEVLFDLYLASQLEPLLRKLNDGISIASHKVVQTYFITESGVIWLHGVDIDYQSQYYLDQFATYTFFRERSYFWRAVDHPNGDGTFDYRSEPYIDLGGNGIVATYSRKLELPNHRAAVVCLDVKLPSTLIDEMRRRLTTLGAKSGEFYWQTRSGGAVPQDFKWFEEDFNRAKNRKEQSKFLGAIRMEQGYQVSTELAQPDTLRFTIPLESSEDGPNEKKTRLMWVSVDFNDIRNALTLDVIMFLVGVVLLVLLSWTMFLEYKVLGHEMTGVLKKMTKVMREASTPFAWLDEKNSFVDVNHKFLEVLEYKNLEELQKEVGTFRALITPQSQTIYQKILEESSQGFETDKYEVSIITGNGRLLSVVVHGERVPYPTFFKRSLPHRFGVFLDVIDPEKLEQEPEQTAPAPAPAPAPKLKALASHA